MEKELFNELRALRNDMNQGFKESRDNVDRIYNKINASEAQAQVQFDEIKSEYHQLDKRTSNIKTKVSLYVSMVISTVILFKDKIVNLIGN